MGNPLILLNNTILTNSWIKGEITGKIENVLKLMKMKILYTIIYVMQLKSCLERNLQPYGLYQKTKKGLNNNPSLHLNKLDTHEQLKL